MLVSMRRSRGLPSSASHLAVVMINRQNKAWLVAQIVELVSRINSRIG